MRISLRGQKYISKGAQMISSNPRRAAKIIKYGLRIEPEEGVGWFNLGLALHQDEKIKGAILAYRQALTYISDSRKNSVINNLAQDLLLNQEFKEGWNLYENRFKRLKKSFEIYEKLYGKMWEGFNDKRKYEKLIVVTEQGYGDTIQFCRLILILQQFEFKVSLFCQESLAPLLRKSTGIENVITSLKQNGEANIRWCPLMSVPKHLKLNKSNVPYGSGYIKIDKTKKIEWGKKLQKDPTKKLVAIHWQGNPNFEKKLYSKGRSINAKHFNSLKNIGNIEFLSIQKGKASKDIEYLKDLKFVKGQSAFDESYDFEDTAAVLNNCDLLISADSSVVHLAGALGIPTWILLSKVPEWRWGLNTKETSWYNKTVLYRQDKRDYWEDVINKISEDLI